MLLVVPLFLALALALGQGGSVRHLAVLPVRGTGLLFGSFAIQLLLYVPGVQDSALARHFGGAIYVCALLLVLAGALRNWQLGMAVRLATLGLVLNTVVIILNGGHMPVKAVAMAATQGQARVDEIAAQQEYSNTELATPSTRLAPLSDVLAVRLPSGYGNVYSVGDALLTTGIAGAVYKATRRPYCPGKERVPGQALADIQAG